MFLSKTEKTKSLSSSILDSVRRPEDDVEQQILTNKQKVFNFSCRAAEQEHEDVCVCVCVYNFTNMNLNI